MYIESRIVGALVLWLENRKIRNLSESDRAALNQPLGPGNPQFGG